MSVTPTTTTVDAWNVSPNTARWNTSKLKPVSSCMSLQTMIRHCKNNNIHHQYSFFDRISLSHTTSSVRTLNMILRLDNDESQEKEEEENDSDNDWSDDALTSVSSQLDLSNMERAWRYSKRPLLSLGAQKGATIKHGNSLRELLNHHTAVKVKVQLILHQRRNNNEDNSSNIVERAMTDVFVQLRDYAVQSGASPDIELLQMREAERTILIGLPGTRHQIETGTYPPITVTPVSDTVE
jgi:hypothetical protein